MAHIHLINEAFDFGLHQFKVISNCGPTMDLPGKLTTGLACFLFTCSGTAAPHKSVGVLRQVTHVHTRYPIVCWRLLLLMWMDQ